MSMGKITEWLQVLVVEDVPINPLDGQMFPFDYIDAMDVIRSWPEFIAKVGQTMRPTTIDAGPASRDILTDPDVLLIDFNFEQDRSMPNAADETERELERLSSLTTEEIRILREHAARSVDESQFQPPGLSDTNDNDDAPATESMTWA